MANPIEMLHDFVKKEEPDDFFEMLFYVGKQSCQYTPSMVDSMVEFLFDKSLTHYMEDFIPYGRVDGVKCSSLILFLKPCNKNHVGTNITPELIDTLKNFLDKAKRGKQ